MGHFSTALVLALVLVCPCRCLRIVSDDQWSFSGVQNYLRLAIDDMSTEVYSRLVSLVGKAALDNAIQSFQGGARSFIEGLAYGLNLLLGYLTEFLHTMGIDVKMPFHHITPEAVVYVAQWTLLALIGYWLLSLTLRLVAWTLRRTFWLLKLTMAVSLFILILSDTSVSTETTAIRLAGLVLLCVLLGIKPTGPKGDKTAHLEAQVKMLERRLKDVEKRKEE